MNDIPKNFAECGANEDIMVIEVETVVDAKEDVTDEDIEKESKCMKKVCFLPVSTHTEMNESHEDKECRYSNSNRIEYSSELFLFNFFLRFFFVLHTKCYFSIPDISLKICEEYTEVGEIPALKLNF